MKKIVCLYGGPGAGKSTNCAGLFYKLKTMGFNCEMNREYIKEWVWEARKVKDGDQTYFFAKQARKERIYMEQGIDVIITDSPLVLTHFYGSRYDQFEQKSNTSLQMLKNHHEICKHYGYKVEHFFLNRAKAYKQQGRFQDENTALKYDNEIKTMLLELNIKFLEVPGNDDGLLEIIKNITGVPFHSVGASR